MAFGTRVKKVAFAHASGIPQTVIIEQGPEMGTKALYVPPQASRTGQGYYTALPVSRTAGQPTRLGFWHNISLGKSNIRGLEGKPPSRAMGWTWTLHSQRPGGIVLPAGVEPPPILREDVPVRDMRYRPETPYTNSVVPKGPAPRPPEIDAAERAPDTPPPAGFDLQALFQTAFDAITGAQREPEIAPAAQPRPFRPAYAPPQVSEEEGPPLAMAGFNMQQLLIPALVIGGLFMARRFL